MLQKLEAARHTSKLTGWNAQLEIELLTAFWARLAAKEESTSFVFKTFDAETVARKLEELERAIPDQKLFRMPCDVPENQRDEVLAACKLLSACVRRIRTFVRWSICPRAREVDDSDEEFVDWRLARKG